MSKKERFEKVEEYMIEFFDKVYDQLHFPLDLKFEYLIDNKQKTLITVKKTSPFYSFILNSEILVVFNGDMFDKFEDGTKNILIEQELSRIETNLEKGTIKIKKPNIMANSSIVEKYTYEKVKDAILCQNLYSEQKEDTNN